MSSEEQKPQPYSIFSKLEKNIFEAGLPNAQVDLSTLMHQELGAGRHEDAVAHEFNAIRILRQKLEMRASTLYEHFCELGMVDEFRKSSGIVLTADRLIAYTNDLFQHRVDQEASRLREEGNDHHRLLTSDRQPGVPSAPPQLFTGEEIATIHSQPEATAQLQVMQEMFDSTIGEALTSSPKKPHQLGR